MTAPATQSNNAAGKRSLPSAFFTPLQTLGRYMERHSGDSQLVETPSHVPDQVGLASGVENGAHEAGNAALSQRGSASGLTIARGTGSEGGPAAFSDVALRVWGARPGQETETPKPASIAFDDGGGGTGGAGTGEGTGEETLDPGCFSAASVAASSILTLEARFNTAVESRRDLEPLLKPAARARFTPGLKTGPDEVQALAHDANNLLSALRLYGELLCFSGVLHERHRHYAEDLKLLSLRSEKIIDRLLRLADEVAASKYAAAAQETSAAALPAPYVAESYGERVSCEVVETSDAKAGQFDPRPDLRPDLRPELRPDLRPDLRPNVRPDLRPDLRHSDRFTDAAYLRPAAASLYTDELEASGKADSRDVPDAGGSIEPISLASVLNRIKGLLGTLAYGALEVDLGSGPGRVPEEMCLAAPVESLERILVNLVANAAAAIRGGGAVRIRAALLNLPESDAENENASEDTSENTNRYATPTVVLMVDDSGCGMSEAQVCAALSFASAEQGPSGETFGGFGVGETDSAEKCGGEEQGQEADQAYRLTRQSHGLGLSIVRELVASTGGRLLIHSRRGTGTRIEIRWKAAEPLVNKSRLIADWPVERIPSGRAHGTFGLGTYSKGQPAARVRAEARFEARMSRALHETDGINEAGLTMGDPKQNREPGVAATAQGAVA